MEFLSKKILDLLKVRIEEEEASSRLYKAMANFLEYNGYSGAAKLWNKYSIEEMQHSKWVESFLLDLDYLPPLPIIKEPVLEFKDLCDIINKSYDHECMITKSCKALASSALAEGDFLTFGLAQKFINEQVEELSRNQFWMDKLEAFGEDKIALRLLDQEMGELA